MSDNMDLSYDELKRTLEDGAHMSENPIGKSREQEVVKDEDTHRYVSPKGANPDETYKTTEEHLSSWQKEWRRLGDTIEIRSMDQLYRDMDELTVAAVLHAQVLKRFDK